MVRPILAEKWKDGIEGVGDSLFQRHRTSSWLNLQTCVDRLRHIMSVLQMTAPKIM